MDSAGIVARAENDDRLLSRTINSGALGSRNGALSSACDGDADDVDHGDRVRSAVVNLEAFALWLKTLKTQLAAALGFLGAN